MNIFGFAFSHSFCLSVAHWRGRMGSGYCHVMPNPIQSMNHDIATYSCTLENSDTSMRLQLSFRASHVFRRL